MVSSCPNVPDDNRYSSKETAEILGIHRSTLRNHTEAGLIKFGLRRTNMRKFYLGREINRYWKAMY
jgi:DNA-binding transcriptional MerR regulator